MTRVIRDRFELLRQVGAGSYGVVHLARDRHTSLQVALKLLSEPDGIAEDRFDREAAVLAELHHPAIVRYVAHGTADDGQRFLAMEWLVGHTLEQHLRRTASVGDVVAVARRVVAGLSFAALRGVTHRDIKPANLFLVDGAPSQTKILDFGLARRTTDRRKLTLTGTIVGTPLYMSPEQARGERFLDPRTDVFSLGTVLYSSLSGLEPFDAAQPLASLAKICFDEPRPLARVAPRTPARLAKLVHAMLCKSRDERPTLASIAEELTAVADELAASGPPAKAGPSAETADVVLDPGGSAGVSASLRTRQSDAGPRVRVATFVGIEGPLSAARESELHALTTGYGAAAQRLLDGSCVVLPSPRLGADEQALSAARCALALRRILGGAARYAVCTGRATVDDLHRHGELFERGAEMLTGGPLGVVRVDAASCALFAGRFELRGDAAVEATLERELLGGDVPRTLLGKTTPFVGRERELAQLELTFAACVDELVARVALVTASPGGGKSRLRHELVQRLRGSGARFTLLLGRGDPMRSGAQFGVLASAIAGWAELTSGEDVELKRAKLVARVAAVVGAERAPRVAAFLGEMIGVQFAEGVTPQLGKARIDPQLMADHMLDSWLAWLEALSAREPVLLCVEDLHWSDPASVRFLEAGLRNSRDRALMVLALARPEVHEAFPKLWAERALLELRLPKLGAKACARLLEALAAAPQDPALRAAIVERADGNPFFLEELVRSLDGAGGTQADSLPVSILGILESRLDELGEEPRWLVRAASVYGESFRLDGVRALLDPAADGLDVEGSLALLCEREILVVGGAPSEREYGFRHALLRDAAYQLMSDDDRALGHRLAATWLAGQGESPALLAEHYERGLELGTAAQLWARAAAQAFDAGSLDDVDRCGERAVRCGLVGEQLGALCATLAQARSYRQDDDGAALWGQRARESLAPRTAPWWRATQVTAIACLRRGAPELEPLVDEMVAHYRADLVMPEQSLAITFLSGECWRLVRDDLAERLAALLPRELPEALRGRPEGLIAVVQAIKAFRAGDVSQALSHAEQALAAQRAVGAVRDEGETLALASHLLHELGAYEEAEARIGEMIAIARRVGSERDVGYGKLYLGSIYARAGRADEAMRSLAEASASAEHFELWSFKAEALGHLAGVQLARGAHADARATAASGLALEGVESAARAYLLARTSSALLGEGRIDDALAAACAARDLAREHDVPEYVVVVEMSYIEALLAAGDAARAAQAIDEAGRALARRAAGISDPRLRQSYLTRVAEHARLMSLVAGRASCAMAG